jgi:hypothetical protein
LLSVGVGLLHSHALLAPHLKILNSKEKNFPALRYLEWVDEEIPYWRTQSPFSPEEEKGKVFIWNSRTQEG